MLMNYIPLEPGIPVRMHFTDDYYVERDIADRDRGGSKKIRSHVFWVDELNGEPSGRTFSILSSKLHNHLQPFLEGKNYAQYDFIITQIGTGFITDWIVEPILRRS